MIMKKFTLFILTIISLQSCVPVTYVPTYRPLVRRHYCPPRYRYTPPHRHTHPHRTIPSSKSPRVNLNSPYRPNYRR